MSVSENKIEYILAYIPEAKDWKFLCVDDGDEIRVVFDFNTKRGNDFIGTTLINTIYVTRKATQEDIDEAMVENL